jgi:[acyl-carrier-protein] S-malonyltransferase
MLVKQVSSPVFWKQSMETMRSSGISRVVELGPGKVLSGLFRRFDKRIPAVSLQTHGDIMAFSGDLSV